MRSLKRNLAQNPLSTSKQLFEKAQLSTEVPKTTRCKILNILGSVRVARKQPCLKPIHMVNRVKWATTYLKQDFRDVLFTDECRATLDGPDGFARGWVTSGCTAPTRQGGGGVMFWAGILDDKVLGPFRVCDGVKMDSNGYCAFLKTNLLPWLANLEDCIRGKLVFMQDNAPSHASNYSREFIFNNGIIKMEWPAASPDMNPIENLWSIVKIQLYCNGKQYSSNDELWNGIQTVMGNIASAVVKKLTSSVDRRLIKILTGKGNYILH